MQEKTTRQWHVEIDLLRIIGIVAVVVIHTTAHILPISNYDLESFSFVLFLNQIARFGVPLFFFISGFVLEVTYPHHANYLLYIKKRFNRIFLPYIFWSFIYFFFVFKQYSFTVSSFLFNALLTGGASYQLYFIPTLLIFYAIFPIIHEKYQFIAKRYILVALGLLQLVLLYVDYYINPIPIFAVVQVALLNYFVFLMGVVFCHHRQGVISFINRRRAFWTSIAIILGIIVFLEGQMFYLATHHYLTISSQWRPSVMLYTLILGGVLYTFFADKLVENESIKLLSRLSFFVFFVHALVLENVWNRLILNGFLSTQSIFIKEFCYTPLLILLTVSISYIIAYVVHKFPLLTKITG